MKDRNKRSVVRSIATLALMAFALTAAGSAWASEYTAARKAGRGFAAVTTGFLEVPGNIVVETRRNGAGSGVTVGFAKGLGGLVVRHLVGAYEIVTAPFPIPAGYRPILRPEFPWGYFDESREYAYDADRGNGYDRPARPVRPVTTTVH